MRNMINGIKVKRIEPVEGNTHTPDWANSTDCAMTTVDSTPTRPSTIAEFSIPLNYKEMQCALDESEGIFNSTIMLDTMLEERTGFKLIGKYSIEAVVVNGNTVISWE
ncbi:MAG: hypothetical protein ACKVJK_21295 [Methylophagaceae bacterium]|jgi:hypothetical protein|tara:strand:+ start:1058 stop:1381 length:324 start_codon:yes stop_codon:yes gene_type:complete